MSYVQKAIELRNERLKQEEKLRAVNKDPVLNHKNFEVYELLKQFNDFVISDRYRLLIRWTIDRLPCLSYAGMDLTAYYDYQTRKYHISSANCLGSFETLDELMEAVTLEVSKL